MRKVIISAIILGSVAVAAPASAQWRGGGGYNQGYNGQNIQRELEQIRDRIHQAENRDRISNREEQRLLNEVRRIDDLYDRYRRGGIDRREARDLQQRIQNLRQRLQFERREDRRDDRRDRRW